MSENYNSRELTVDILSEVLEQGGYSHIVLGRALNKYAYLSKQDRAMITRIVEGTIEYEIQIDYVLNLFSNTKTTKMKPFIRTLMRMSVYQILYMDRVPDSAICDEAVKLAAKRHFIGLKGFVNGTLRTICREKEHISWPDDTVKYSMPKWLLSMLSKQYGTKRACSIAGSFLIQKPLCVRFNLSLGTQKEIEESLKKQNIAVTKLPFSDALFYLNGIDSIEKVEAFHQGLIQIQDASSALVAYAAGPSAGNYVIDVCGAPGGKSLHVADLLHGTGMVDVRDLTEDKVRMINDNIDRCGFHNITAKIQDALEEDPLSVEKADIVLADLPCSGLGIIAKKPDIKRNMTPEKIESLKTLQKSILSVVWKYVKKGGILVYSTCTINREENEEQVTWFLKQFPFEPVDLSNRIGTGISSDTLEKGYVQILPDELMDGFFISAFRRI